MKKMIIKIRKTHVLPFLLIIILFVPSIVTQYALLNSVISVALNCILFTALFFWGIRKFRCSNWLKGVAIFGLIIVVSTTINRGEIDTAFIQYLKLFASCLIIEQLIEKHKKETLTILKNALFFLVLTNLITMIIMPDGIINILREENEWYQYYVSWWVFGNKNAMFLWLIVTNMLAQISLINCANEQKMSIYDYVIVFATIITAILSESSTTLAAIVLCSLFVPLRQILVHYKLIFNLKNYTIIYIILSLILFTSTQLEIIQIGSALFGKDATFTGRVIAWSNSLQLIGSSPLWGYGVLGIETTRSMLGGYAFLNAHNSLLQFGLEGGIILVVVVVLLFKILTNNIRRIPLQFETYICLIGWIIFAIFIEMSFEDLIDSAMFWMIFTMIYHLKYLIGATEGL